MVVSLADGIAQEPGKTGENRERKTVLAEIGVGGGAARRSRTSLHKGRMVVPYAAQRPRHSARAAARLALNRGLLERLRSWLKWFETEA